MKITWKQLENLLRSEQLLKAGNNNLHSSLIDDPKTVNFVQKLAQNWPKRKNHLPEIRVSG